VKSRLLVSLLCAFVSLAGCAAIPDELPAKGVPGAEGAAPHTASVAEPERDLAPYDLVRDFIQVSANPDNDYAAAKPYLTKAAQAKWQPASSVTIIQDTFGTRYDPNVPSDPAKGNRSSVALTTQRIGRLGGDKSFVPESGAGDTTIALEKQSDGQWRISEPPTGVFVTLSKFNETYRQVRLYFLDPQKRVLVPDLRYVAAQPSNGVPGRVADLLLQGPSDGLQDAVVSALAPSAALRTGAVETADGAFLINLTKPGDTSPVNVKLMIAQIVWSLQTSTNARIRIQVDGSPISPERPDWRLSDLPAYDTGTSPSPDLPGMVVQDGHVGQLDGKHVNGPAGNGEYSVVSAAQSIDGTELALVTSLAQGSAQLRVGELNWSAPAVDLTAASLTRPTWLSTNSASDASNEVWTVADATKVVRAVKSSNGSWVARAVNAAELSQFGPITALRLSRDGVRVAVIAGGQLIVGAVVRTPNSDTVAIRAPRLLQPNGLSDVVGVDWLAQDQLVVATSTTTIPVAQLVVDGGPFGFYRYNPANLNPPMTAVTAASSRPVIAADAGSMWTSSDVGSVWRPQSNSTGHGSAPVPFYPG
jgi:Lipoprotein LpqB beta-propeller domain/Sporulation and spore germination